jgi:DNA-directed RNA polymerase subunit K/omega
MPKKIKKDSDDEAEDIELEKEIEETVDNENEGDDDDEIETEDESKETKDDSDSDELPELFDINQNNNISVKPEELKKEDRITRNKLTKYEMVRILGERTKQLTMGAKPLIKNIEGLSYDIIAEEELKLNMIPYKIKRPLPNGKVEIWTLDELDKSHLLSYLE